MYLKASAASLAALLSLANGVFSWPLKLLTDSIPEDEATSLLAISSRLHQRAKSTNKELQNKTMESEDFRQLPAVISRDFSQGDLPAVGGMMNPALAFAAESALEEAKRSATPPTPSTATMASEGPLAGYTDSAAQRLLKRIAAKSAELAEGEESVGLGMKVHVKGAGADGVNGMYIRGLPYELDDGAIVVATTRDKKWQIAYYPESAGSYGPAWYIQKHKGLKGAYVKKLDKDPDSLRISWSDLRIPADGWAVYNDGKYSLPGLEPPPSFTFDKKATEYVWTAKGAAFANGIHGTMFTPGSDVPPDYVKRAMLEFGVQHPIKSVRDVSRWLMVEKHGKNDADAVDNWADFANEQLHHSKENLGRLGGEDLSKKPVVEGDEWKLIAKPDSEIFNMSGSWQEQQNKIKRNWIKGYVDTANHEFQTPWLWMDSPQGAVFKYINDYRKGIVNVSMSSLYDMASNDREDEARALNDLMMLMQPRSPEGHEAFRRASDIFSNLYTEYNTRKQQFKANQERAQNIQRNAPIMHRAVEHMNHKFEAALGKMRKVKLKIGHGILNGGG